MKGAFFFTAFAAVALSGKLSDSSIADEFEQEFTRRSSSAAFGNIVRGNNNAVSGSGNVVDGTENRLYGDENNLSGDNNLSFGSGSEVEGCDNWVVGNRQQVRGSGIRMFGPQAGEFFLKGGYRRPQKESKGHAYGWK